MLAAGAIVSTPPGLTNLLYYPTTTQTGLTGAIVNPRLNLEAPRPAVAVDVIANTAAARRNRIRQGLPDRLDEHATTRPTDPVGRPQR